MSYSENSESLFDAKYFEVVDIEGWVGVGRPNYSYVPKNVIIIPFIEDKILAIREKNPLRKTGFSVTAISGDRNAGESILASAQRELEEETGFKIPTARFQHVNNITTSKLVQFVNALVLVDITGYKAGVRKTDGSTFEKESRPVWVMNKDILKTQCSLLQAGLLHKEYLYAR